MVEINLNLNHRSRKNEKKRTILNTSRRVAIKCCMQLLVYAYLCKRTDCGFPSCTRMKNVMKHTTKCDNMKIRRNCTICNQFFALCVIHAVFCQDETCVLPMCFVTKYKMKQQQITQIQRYYLTKRYMTVINPKISKKCV